MMSQLNIPIKELSFIQKANYHLPIVIDGQWVNSIGIVRSLGVLGIKSVVINHIESGAALYSKYVGASLICPDPWNNPNKFIEYMKVLGRIFQKKGVLLITDDTYLRILSQARNKLSEYFIFSFPEIKTLSKIMDKSHQYKEAQDLGIRVPYTIQVQGKEDLSKFEKLDFPVLIKGLEGKEFFRKFEKQVIEVNSIEEILNVLHNFPTGKLIIQEKIVGDESNLYSFCCYMNRYGQVKSIFTGRKLHQYPRDFGTCSIAQSVRCDEIVDPSINLLRKLKFFGIAQVEYKKIPATGVFCLIEVNARFWKWHSLATASRKNIAGAAYFDLIDKPLEENNQNFLGLKWISFPEEILGVISDLKNNRFNLVLWIINILPPFTLGLFSWSDLLPFIMSLKYRVFAKSKK